MKHLCLLLITAVLAGCVDVTDPGDGASTGSLTVGRDALVFNAGGSIPSDLRTLTLSNTGAAALTLELSLTGPDAARFGLSDAGPLELATGTELELGVTFTPTAGGTLGPQHATLTVSGAGLETALVYLGGLSVRGQEGTNEPSVQWIFDTYGFPVSTGDTDPTTSPLVDTVTNTPVGDEVVAQTFRRADPSRPVSVEVLATFAVPDVAPVYTFGVYGAGDSTPTLQPLFGLPIVPGLNGQRLDPAITPVTGGAPDGIVSFEPPAETFGFYSSWPTTRFFDERTVFTESARNSFRNALPHHVRVYPLKARDGAVVENAYILATDESNRLNDFNDAVLLVRNVAPVQ